MMDKTILIINNTGFLSYIPELLMDNGYGVDTVSNPEMGFRLLDERNYHLLMVLERPAGESWRLCEKIRRVMHTPLIIISADASTETCVKAINAGADYFMRKPFGPLELLARVESLVQRTSSRQIMPVVSE